METGMNFLQNSPMQLGRRQAYLVRLWQSSPQGLWRASAYRVKSTETKYFPDLQSLFAFLQAQVDSHLTSSQGTPWPDVGSDDA